MARPLRIEGEGCVYHLTSSGDRRMAIFEDNEDRRRFIKRQCESLERFNVELHAWVLMGNHFHLLARTREANLSRWMQWVAGSVDDGFQPTPRLLRPSLSGALQPSGARQPEKTARRVSAAARSNALLVEERGYFAELGRYIHLNPVRGTKLGGGGVKERRQRLRAFEWSSYRAYAGLVSPPAWRGCGWKRVSVNLDWKGHGTDV